MTVTTLCVMLALLQPGEELRPSELWGDRIAEEAKRAIVPGTETVTEAARFAAIWKAWRPGEPLPQVDFDKSFVLVATTDGPNRMFANLRKAGGDVTAVFGSTKIGGPGFGYLIAVVPRDGIKTINGTPIAFRPGDGGRKKPQPDDDGRDFVRIEMRGTLETGIVAIGGETTGTVLHARGMTFELDIPEGDLRELAESLNGRRVRVAGELQRKQGVETGPRWIVAVKALSPARGKAAQPDPHRETDR